MTILFICKLDYKSH